MKYWIVYLPMLLALLGLVVMVMKFSWIKKQSTGEEKMQIIAKHIKEGAMAFLRAEYRMLLVFVIVASGLLFLISYIVPTTHWLIVPAFIMGAIFSAVAGNIGMRVATDANVRTTEAAKTSLPKALKVSFGGGIVMGLGVAGLAVLVGSIVIYAVGLPYMALILNVYFGGNFSLIQILQMGLIIFIPGDIIKAILAVSVGSRLQGKVARSQSSMD